jgi:hypothetical protein
VACHRSLRTGQLPQRPGAFAQPEGTIALDEKVVAFDEKVIALDENHRLDESFMSPAGISLNPSIEGGSMLRKGIAFAALSLCGLAPAVAKAEMMPPANPWELTLGATASNGNKFNGFSGAGDISIGYYFSENLELAVRQSITYTDVATAGKGSAIDGTTRLAVDWHFQGLGDHSQFVPFVGANLGFVYGDNVKDTWEAAPEAGVKWYMNSSTFVYAMAEYEFFFKKGNSVGNGFRDGQFVYSVGIGFRL